jgi:arylsulfatase A-like enzyme
MSENNLSRRSFLKMVGLSTATLAVPRSLSVAKARNTKPNIIFIMVDDLGKDMISCYGSEKTQTPNIDALAAKGARFTNAYSMPQCVPTRVTVLTGQYPFRHGWVNHYDVPRWGKGCHFDPNYNPCIARVIKSAGYSTCIAGKWQISDFRIQPDILNEVGFDEYCVWTGYEKGNPSSAKRYWDAYLHTDEGSKTYKDQFGPDICNQFIIDFIGKHKAEPMMVYYPMILTHGPLTSTPHHRDVSSKKVMVEYMDYLVGRLVEALDKSGIREKTILIWSTDNGPAKGKTIEKGVCEPFVVNCPGLVPQGIVTDALVDFTDILPTFAEIAAAKLPKGHIIDGKSFAPLILGKVDDSKREWIMAMGGGGTSAQRVNGGYRVFNRHEYRDRVIRDKRYKLYIGRDRRSDKLVDLNVDQEEQHNILTSNDPAVRAALVKLEKVAANFPEKDANPKYDPLPLQPWDLKEDKTKNKPKKQKKRKRR